MLGNVSSLVLVLFAAIDGDVSARLVLSPPHADTSFIVRTTATRHVDGKRDVVLSSERELTIRECAAEAPTTIRAKLATGRIHGRFKSNLTSRAKGIEFNSDFAESRPASAPASAPDSTRDEIDPEAALITAMWKSWTLEADTVAAVTWSDHAELMALDGAGATARDRAAALKAELPQAAASITNGVDPLLTEAHVRSRLETLFPRLPTSALHVGDKIEPLEFHSCLGDVSETRGCIDATARPTVDAIDERAVAFTVKSAIDHLTDRRLADPERATKPIVLTDVVMGKYSISRADGFPVSMHLDWIRTSLELGFSGMETVIFTTTLEVHRAG